MLQFITRSYLEFFQLSFGQNVRQTTNKRGWSLSTFTKACRGRSRLRAIPKKLVHAATRNTSLKRQVSCAKPIRHKINQIFEAHSHEGKSPVQSLTFTLPPNDDKIPSLGTQCETQHESQCETQHETM